MPSTLADRLRMLFPDASGVSRKDWLARGRVTVNGAVVRDGRAEVAAADRIRLGAETVARVTLPRALRPIHEDDHILVVEKPADLLTIATETEQDRTAYRMVYGYLASKRPPVRPLIVHRLDRQTSGLLVFAKSVAVKRDLQQQFAARTVTREYVAVVEGGVARDAGTLEDRIVQSSALRVRRARGPEEGARVAVTRYRVRDRGPNTTLLDLTLGTGRRHQIRVQLAALGHPVVGDRTYHAKTDPIRRLCLHATALGFTHPGTRKPVRYESPAPPAFAKAHRRR
ncbi:MAG: RluA family pseudouridine synthase [Deltaproteobacteria bacterium]|nr:RluA family pseudouridine synthase [Deltaproteobacteria bacterium]